MSLGSTESTDATLFNPLVSIVITSYNRARYIEDAVKSALAQDYPNLEIIISDNCSSDNTLQVLQAYLHDKRIKLHVNDKNIGMIPNFKLATELASGEYITYLSSDDYFINETFVTQAINAISKNRNVVIVFSKNETFVEETNKVLVEKDLNYASDNYLKGKQAFIKFATRKGLGWGGTLLERKKLLAINVFEKPINSIDYETNLMLLLMGDAYFISKPSYTVRLHEKQASQTITAKKLIENYQYLYKPYDYAKANNFFSTNTLENWKNELLLVEARKLDFLPDRRDEHDYLMNYFKENHFHVYQKLQKNIKWNVLKFIHSRPKLKKTFISIYELKYLANKKV